MNDKVVALLRTWFPVGWSALIVWLVTRVPALAPVQGWLAGLGEPLLTVLIAVVVYPLLRWLESRVWFPDWLTRIFLGSAKTPSYEGK